MHELTYRCRTGISACVSLMELSAALAQARTVAVTQCLFSGPIGVMTGSAIGDPLRYEVDADGRALLIIHKVQTNGHSNH